MAHAEEQLERERVAKTQTQHAAQEAALRADTLARQLAEEQQRRAQAEVRGRVSWAGRVSWVGRVA
jgi:hypothetical protein|eukprot:SAG25_NODE_2735_length_1415_cov_1.192249_2_plen_66_part_00